MNDFYYVRKEISEGETVEVIVEHHLYQVKKKGACIEVFDGDFRKVIPHSKYMNIDTYEEFKEYIRKMFE